MSPARGENPSRRRMRGPLLGEEFIKVVAQTIPDLPPLKPEVPRVLAADAEYRIREVIRQAKCYMKHSKRACLTVEDVENAYKKRDNQPVLGYHGSTPGEHIEYIHVEGTSAGLYIPKDEVVKLTDVISAELPPKRPMPSIEARWVAINGHSQTAGDQSTNGGKRRLPEWAQNEFCSYAADVTNILGESEDDFDVEIALKAVATAKTIQAILPDFIVFIRQKVHENARAGGRTEVLFNMTRLLYGIFSRGQFGVELHYDQLFPALLTCLLGRRLGRGDHWAVRNLAALALQETFRLHEDPVSRGRTTKTLVAILTDAQSPLESIYGAIRGLAAMGDEIFQYQFLPHLPALLRGLEEAAVACGKLEDGPRTIVEDKISRICEAIEDATREQGSSDSDILMEVTL